MNCIIVDDEPLARQGLELLLKNMPQLIIKGSFNNAIDAGAYLNKEKVDIIFLDINMPELNGFDFLKTLIDKPLVIFITAYPQYAVESYELDAIDYLVKPVRLERLIKAVNKAELFLKPIDPASNAIESIEKEFVYIKADRKFTKVFFKDIVYIEGLKDYVTINLDNKKIVTAMNIKTIANQLPTQIFARVNRSYIVNVNHIISVDTYSVYLKSEEIPIGESYKNEFLNNYVLDNTIKRN
jgi:DNA-binding LytR/AlgR family response regulator